MRSRPHRPKIVVVLAQVSHRFSTDTAGPDVTIGRNLRRSHPSQAGNDLPLLHQRTFDYVVVAISEGLCDARYAVKLGFTNAFLQAFDHWLVFLDRWSDAHPDGI